MGASKRRRERTNNFITSYLKSLDFDNIRGNVSPELACCAGRGRLPGPTADAC